MQGVQMSFDWGVAVVLLLIGFAAGLLAFWLLRPGDRRARELETELDKTREDLEHYRADVNRHFERTSQLFGELTENYKTLYTHLAQGAGELCGDQNRPPQLDMPETGLLTQREQAPDAESEAVAPAEAPEDAPPRDTRARPSDDKEETHLGDTPRITDLDSARAEEHPEQEKPQRPE
ncbi:MAG: YhcB family protein [Gammaproteobacteria bacterium]|jgi:uncharacterized protein